MKRVPLVRKTPLGRGAGLARSALPRAAKALPKRSAKARDADGALVEFRLEVHRRAGGACQVQADGCMGMSTHAHHRRISARRARRHDPDEGLAVCASCHVYVHANPAVSYEKGWLLRG